MKMQPPPPPPAWARTLLRLTAIAWGIGAFTVGPERIAAHNVSTDGLGCGFPAGSIVELLAALVGVIALIRLTDTDDELRTGAAAVAAGAALAWVLVVVLFVPTFGAIPSVCMG